MNFCGGGLRSPYTSFLKNVFFLFIFLSLFTGLASAEEITVLPSTYAIAGEYDGDLLLENQYSTGFVVADIDFSTSMGSTQYSGLSTNDDTFVISGGDNKADGFLYVDFKVPNVASINSMYITTVSTGDENYYMGAWNDGTSKWETMNSTTSTSEVTMTYLVEGAEIASYSEITGTDATFSVAIWESDKDEGVINGDLISVVFNYEQPGEIYSTNVSDSIFYTDSVSVTKTTASVQYDTEVSDTTIYTDSVSIIKTVAAVLYDTGVSDIITFTDTVSLTKTVAPVAYKIYVSDTFTFADSEGITKKVSSIADDTITFIDSVSITKIVAAVFYNINVPDTVTFTDVVLVTKTIAPVLYTIKNDDAFIFSDNVGITKTAAPIFYNLGVEDEFTFTDSVFLTKTIASVQYNSEAQDSISFTDSVQVTKTEGGIKYDAEVSDIIIFTDDVSITKSVASVQYDVNIPDTISYNDYISISKTISPVNYSVYSDDVFTFADSVSVTKTTASIQYDTEVNDTITYSDSVSITKTEGVILYDTEVNDTITFTDNVSIFKTVAPVFHNVKQTDFINYNDNVSIIKTTAVVNYDINVNDSITYTDSVMITKTEAPIIYDEEIFDSITYTDSVMITKTEAPIIYDEEIFDSITYTDSVMITKTVASVVYDINVNDSITYTDSVLVTKTPYINNYKVYVSDTFIFTDSINLDEINLKNFTFSNESINPSTVKKGIPFTVSVDINDSDGTIVDAMARINNNNYDMVNTVGDTWIYTFTATSVIARYAVTDFYAQDDDGAWNSTTSNLYIDVISNIVSAPYYVPPAPIVTPTEKPKLEEKEIIDVITDISKVIKRAIPDESLLLFRINYKTNVQFYSKEFYKENALTCKFPSESIEDCKIEDTVGTVKVLFNPDKECIFYNDLIHTMVYNETTGYYTYINTHIVVINLMAAIYFNTNTENPSTLLFSTEDGMISGIRVWWLMTILLIGICILKIRKKPKVVMPKVVMPKVVVPNKLSVFIIKLFIFIKLYKKRR